MKIGLLGGSFNPIHNGHIEIALAAIKQDFVQQVWFIPSYIHPLKNHNGSVDFVSRLELIKKAISNLPDCLACDFEKRYENISFTEKLMKFLYQRFPEHNFHFMIGWDIIPELNRWYNYSWLKDNVNFLVITRLIEQDISATNDLKSCQFLKIAPINISSTRIRNLISQRKSIKGLVPEIIEQDIIEIYQKNLTK